VKVGLAYNGQWYTYDVEGVTGRAPSEGLFVVVAYVSGISSPADSVGLVFGESDVPDYPNTMVLASDDGGLTWSADDSAIWFYAYGMAHE